MKMQTFILLLLVTSVLSFSAKLTAANVLGDGIIPSSALSSSRWPGNEIAVCWENPSDNTRRFEQITRDAVDSTWAASSSITFVGWRECENSSKGIRIRIRDEGPHVKGLGSFINGVPEGMVLNFDFRNWCPDCAAKRDQSIYNLAVHEFGHALGFAHEQNRADSNCQNERQGTDGTLYLTPYDLHSVMNYCNPRWNGDGSLSALDKLGLRVWYGSSFVPPFHLAGDGVSDLGARFVDVDHDGSEDLVYYRWVSDSLQQIGAYKNTRAGWLKLSEEFNPPHHIAGDIANDRKDDLGVRFVDVDHDGFEDLIFNRWISDTVNQIGAYKNTGRGWNVMDSQFNPPHHISGDGIDDLGVRFVDVDHDGFEDLIYHRWISNSLQQIGAYKNTGRGWQRMDSKFAPPHHVSGDGMFDLGVRFVDVDHDGYRDMIFHRWISESQQQIGAYRNTGDGWSAMDSTYHPPHHISGDGVYDLGVRFVDIDHDGYEDLIYHRWVSETLQQVGAYKNTGSGWAVMDQSLYPPHHIAGDGLVDLGVRFVDVNHDGYDDLVYHRYIREKATQVGAFVSTGSGWKDTVR